MKDTTIYRMLFCIKKPLISLLAVVTFLPIVSAQDPVFSQYYNSPIQLNPALAGNNYAPLFAINYRTQWRGIDRAYNTFAVSYDQFFSNSNSGIGMSLLTDAAGDGALKHTKANFTYSYRMKVKGETYLRGAIQVGFLQRTLNWDKFVFGDGINPQFGSTSPGGARYPTSEIQPDNLSKSLFDVGAGFILYDRNYFFGISLDNLTKPEDIFLRNIENNYVGIPPRINVHGGYRFNIGNVKYNGQGSYMIPSFLFSRQGDFNQFHFGSQFVFNELLLSGSFRFANVIGDAVILAAGYQVRNTKIMYSFDFTVSKLNINGGGAHEIGIVINLEDYFPKESKYNDCLQLFR